MWPRRALRLRLWLRRPALRAAIAELAGPGAIVHPAEGTGRALRRGGGTIEPPLRRDVAHSCRPRGVAALDVARRPDAPRCRPAPGRPGAALPAPPGVGPTGWLPAGRCTVTALRLPAPYRVARTGFSPRCREPSRSAGQWRSPATGPDARSANRTTRRPDRPAANAASRRTPDRRVYRRAVRR